MVYAVAMGNGQKVAKALAVKYPEAVSVGTDAYDDDMYRWLQDMVLYDAMDSIVHEIADIKEPTTNSSIDPSRTDWSDSGGGFSVSGGGSDSVRAVMPLINNNIPDASKCCMSHGNRLFE